MVMPRGSESWRRMSRFRRQSLVKPLAAEVLEPRCLMTDALGACLPTPPLEESAAPLTGDVVIGPDLWDDAGLTLQQIGDLLHVFRTDTQTDVITPMLANRITDLNIIGRDNAADILTIDLSFGWALNVQVRFDGGSDWEGNRLRLTNASNQFNCGRNNIQYSPTIGHSGWVTGRVELWDDELWRAGVTDSDLCVYYANAVSIEDWIVSKSSSHVSTRSVGFGAEANHVVYDRQTTNGVSLVSDSTTGVEITFAELVVPGDRAWILNRQIAIQTYDGDDQVVVQQTVSDPDLVLANDRLSVDCGRGNDVATNVSGLRIEAFGQDGDDTLIAGLGGGMLYGGAGNDSLFGHSGRDFLFGNEGDDLLIGNDGDDSLAPGTGHDVLDGGLGTDELCESIGWGIEASGGNVALATDSLRTPNSNASLVSIETASLSCWGTRGFRMDASGFNGPVFLQGGNGDDTLIGSAFNDILIDYGESNDCLQGGAGNDWLCDTDGNDWLQGGPGDDLLYAGRGNDWLEGNDGNDKLDGGEGANTLSAGNGSDTLVKNSRRDVLRWSGPTTKNSIPSATAEASPTTNNDGNVSDDTSDIPNDGGDVSDSPSPGDVLLIGQGIATVGIENREWAEFDTAGSDSTFGELADSEPEDDEGPTAETLADSGDLAANGGTNSADVSEELQLDAALSDELLTSLAKQAT